MTRRETTPPEGRITLMLTSPRVAAGLLCVQAWERLRAADVVLVADPDPEWAEAFEGLRVLDVASLPVAERAGRLVEMAAGTGAQGTEAIWWGGPDGDPGLTDALAEHLSRRAIAGRPPEIEVITASHDVPGARLLDLVRVMDVLRSPGGCPWDAKQTHASLLPYLLEETHEVIEAVEAYLGGRGDREHVQEELGDLLLQVVFHARLAEEDQAAPFDVDDVAAGIVAKLVRRHPHVFGGELEADTAEQVEQNWEQLKAAEKPGRAGFDGIPASLPALARAQKMLARLDRDGQDPAATADRAADGDPVARALLAAVVTAREGGVDAEATLRAVLARF